MIITYEAVKIIEGKVVERIYIEKHTYLKIKFSDAWYTKNFRAMQNIDKIKIENMIIRVIIIH